jgi:hypothetical protein
MANYLLEKQQAIANGNFAHRQRGAVNRTKNERELGFQ